MGKITDALKKAAQERLTRIEKIDSNEIKYQFVARKTVDSKFDPRIVTFFDTKSTIAEQYRTLRTNLMALNTKHPVKVITITSSTHAEGKTITTINLAISMAQDLNKKQILLIDADLRRASISKYLGLKGQAGLSEILSDSQSTQEALLHVGIDNLTILTAGKVPHNPAELLGSTKLRTIIQELRQKYDFIIIDTPPLIPVTDAGIVATQTDGAVMVIKANVTQRGIVKHSQELLAQAQCKILGFILTNIQYHIPGYIYRYL